MRPLTRPAKPDILVRKEQDWLVEFKAAKAQNQSARPKSGTYNHKEVRETLECLGQKCFYSETTGDLEIDHYVEVGVDSDRAFDWDNLYLSHKKINQYKNKKVSKDISLADTIDPMNTSWKELEDEIEIRGDFYSSIGNKGIKTIAKYGLNEDWLCLQRSRAIQEFDKFHKQFIKQDGGTLSDKSKRLLRAFANEDKPFTFMFRCILKQHELWGED